MVATPHATARSREGQPLGFRPETVHLDGGHLQADNPADGNDPGPVGPRAGGGAGRAAGGGAAAGLVICAATPRDLETADTSGALTTADLDDLAGLRFPSPQMVRAAAGLLTPALRVDVGQLAEIHEGPVRELTVSPGVIGTRQRDYARAERRHERQAEARRKAIDMRVANGLPDQPEPAGKITAWSRKSRSNMRRKLAALDWRPMTEHSPIPAMITLTMPGRCGHCRAHDDYDVRLACRSWVSFAPNRKHFGRLMETFKTRYARSWGHKIRGPWKLETQRREAPHLHILMAPPRGTSDQRFAHGGLPFREWLSRTWSDVVFGQLPDDQPEPDGLQRADHVKAGTGVDFAEGLKARDPRRVAAYFSKHGTFSAKEYQHTVPAEWLEDGGSGRWWGVWGLQEATVAVAVTPREHVQAERLLRRLSRSKRYVRAERRDRVELATGRVRRRKVNRRTHILEGRHKGLYLILNDAPSVMAQIALWLPTVSGPDWRPPEPSSAVLDVREKRRCGEWRGDAHRFGRCGCWDWTRVDPYSVT